MSALAERPQRQAATRYLLAVLAVVLALGLRILLEPWTGGGAPYALTFAAVLAVSLFVGFVLMLTSTVIAMGITGGSWTVTPALSMMTSGVSRGVSSAMQSTARRGR